MSCYAPVRAYTLTREDGSQKIGFRPFLGSMPTELSCGSCIGCRVGRAREWAVRLMHEAQMHYFNIFATMTYADDKLPKYGSLVPRDLQLFIKRLRKHFAPHEIRYYAVGEYGEQTWRPHYHALFFGAEFEDRKLWKQQNDTSLYTSETFSKLWGHGHVLYGAVTLKSAEYCAKYAIKKITGPKAEEHYRRVDPTTGEVFHVEPEFSRMSLKPGIGGAWLDKFHGDVYPSDEVVVSGKVRGKAPRYYDRRIAKEKPEVVEAVKAARAAFAQEPRQAANSTPARLRAREAVTRAKLEQRKREL